MKIHGSMSCGNKSYSRGDDIPWYEVYPFFLFLYFILYTFLLRNAVLDLTKARDDENRKKVVENAYIVVSLVVYAASYFMRR